MRKIKLTRMEKELERTAHEFVNVSREEFDEIARAIEAKRKDAILHIRINNLDLEGLKRKAKKRGVKYQTFISEILHRIAHS